MPYSTEPSISDAQNYILPAMPFDQVLDSLITSLEQVKGDAVRRYFQDDSPNAYQNSSKITRWAVYALLADLNLWKGNWDEAINYCDQVIDFKRQQYQEMLEREGNVNDIALIDSIPMILEKPLGSTVCGHAYDEIFGAGNSFESIFELYFNNDNTWVGNYYGNSQNVMGRLSCPDFIAKEVAQGNGTIFKRTDGRAYESTVSSNSSYAIAKYTRQAVSYDTKNVSTEKDLKLIESRRSSDDANWIFYRLSDIVLMRAEAMSQLATTQEELLESVQAIREIFKRSNPYAYANTNNHANTDSLNTDFFSTSNEMLEALVMAERQREFVGEGKRWFDLVRFAQRKGNTAKMFDTYLGRKYGDNKVAVKSKLSTITSLFMPVHRDDMSANPLLHQNSVWNTSESTSKTDKL